MIRIQLLEPCLSHSTFVLCSDLLNKDFTTSVMHEAGEEYHLETYLCSILLVTGLTKLIMTDIWNVIAYSSTAYSAWVVSLSVDNQFQNMEAYYFHLYSINNQSVIGRCLQTRRLRWAYLIYVVDKIQFWTRLWNTIFTISIFFKKKSMVPCFVNMHNSDKNCYTIFSVNSCMQNEIVQLKPNMVSYRTSHLVQDWVSQQQYH